MDTTGFVKIKMKTSPISVRSLLEIMDVKAVMSFHITYGAER